MKYEINRHDNKTTIAINRHRFSLESIKQSLSNDDKGAIEASCELNTRLGGLSVDETKSLVKALSELIPACDIYESGGIIRISFGKFKVLVQNEDMETLQAFGPMDRDEAFKLSVDLNAVLAAEGKGDEVHASAVGLYE